MEPEIKPASPPRISLWPVALLGTLLFALLPSKRNQSGKPIHPQDSTNNEDSDAHRQPALTANAVPGKPNTSSADGSKHNTPLWEKLAVIIALGLLIANSLQTRFTFRQVQEMIGQQRPWLGAAQTIKLTDKPVLKLFDDKGTKRIEVLLRFSASVHNFGGSPAYGEYDTFSTFFTDQTMTPQQMEQWFCKFTFNTNSPLHETTTTIFPTETKDEGHDHGVIFIPFKADYYAPAQRPNIGIIGCIYYRDRSGEPRHTIVVYDPVYIEHGPGSPWMYSRDPLIMDEIVEFKITSSDAD